MKWVLCLIAGLVLWLLLFWAPIDDLWVLGTGVFFALIVGALLGDIYPEGLLPKVLNPVRWLYFLIYLPYFLWYCIRANFDVALRVIHPDVPIQPGIVKVRTTLTSDMAKTFLANSITLTPGTLTMDIDGQDLYIHWINIHTRDAAKRTAEICERFEPLLRRIFE
ncbi:MAG TPA: Na+/H+ antiporter subunit E [Phycisphaerae bacterium]|nr:Na+/H+ antiporter subunit E [Phycisphaerae bacterium]